MAPASLPVVAGNGGALENARNRLVRENRDRARQTKVDEEGFVGRHLSRPCDKVSAMPGRSKADDCDPALCTCNNLLLHCIGGCLMREGVSYTSCVRATRAGQGGNYASTLLTPGATNIIINN